MTPNGGESFPSVPMPGDRPDPSSPSSPSGPSGPSSPSSPSTPASPSYPAAPFPGSAVPADAFGIGPATPLNAPPPGYVAYGSTPAMPLERTAGLAMAVKVLFWITIAVSAVSAFALFSRRGVWDDFLAGEAGFTDIDAADDFVGITSLLSLALTVASGVVLSIWSLRAARNLKTLGAHGVSPGWACGGWYIPIANLFVPYIQLRKGLTGTGGDTNSLVVWQTLFIGSAVSGWVVQQAFDGSSPFTSTDQVSDQLTTQSVAAMIQVLLLVGAAVFAMRSIDAIQQRFSAGPATSAPATEPAAG